MRVLVTGGAGYVGSHVTRALLEAGHAVSVLDDLSMGHRELVRANGVPLHEGDVGDPRVHDAALPGVDAVVHCAGKSLVSESVTDPGIYWRVNVEGGRALLEGMRRHGVTRLVFSSTAAVYGVPDTFPITEAAPCRPMNPYGTSKLAFEHLLVAYARAYGLRPLALRYFNVAGAHSKGDLFERHEPETHLLPRALAAAAAGTPIDVHGDDYPTRDGTAERDYVHVEDLARAHVQAIETLDALGPLERRPAGLGNGGLAMNIGTGRGLTVREVLDAIDAVVGRATPRKVGPRRAGDPPALVASPERARAVLGFEARHDVKSMVASAWRVLSSGGGTSAAAAHSTHGR